MRAGRLDRFITIQAKGGTRDGAGEKIVAWTDVERRRPASRSPVRGEEREGSPQEVATEQVEFRVLYSANVASLTPNHRIIDPALETGETGEPALSRIYDVLTCHEIGTREGVRIICERRTDA